MRRLLVLALLVPAMANAHGLADPRVIVLVVAPGRVELRVNEVSPIEESVSLRKRFDGDRNGTLDDSERSDLETFLALRATTNLRVTAADGKAIQLKTEERALRGAEGALDASDALSVDVVLSATVREASVTIADWRTDAHPVRLAVLADRVALRSTSAGSLDAGRGVVTGVDLERGKSLTLAWTAAR